MKFIFLALLLCSGIAQASDPRYCNGQVIQDNWGSYYPNGRKVKDNWGTYYPNGQILRDNWGSYFPNKQLLSDNWGTYYPNGKVTKDNWGIYYHNGQKTQDSWGCYWPNGTKMEPCRATVSVKAHFAAGFDLIYVLDTTSGKLSDFEFREYDSIKKLLTTYSADPVAGEVTDIDARCDL